jgi:elongation factor P--beta-lysine ligase
VEEEEVCCYAPQNKVITHDPDGTMFEWYRVLGDSMTFFGEEEEKAEEQSST